MQIDHMKIMKILPFLTFLSIGFYIGYCNYQPPNISLLETVKNNQEIHPRENKSEIRKTMIKKELFTINDDVINKNESQINQEDMKENFEEEDDFSGNDGHEYMGESYQDVTTEMKYTIDTELMAETEDNQWSQKMKNTLTTTIYKYKKLQDIMITDQVCGQTLCRVEVATSSSGNSEQFEEKINIFSEAIPSKKSTFVVFNVIGQTYSSATIYISREGVGLPLNNKSDPL